MPEQVQCTCTSSSWCWVHGIALDDDELAELGIYPPIVQGACLAQQLDDDDDDDDQDDDDD